MWEYCLKLVSIELCTLIANSDELVLSSSEHWQPSHSWTACEEYRLSFVSIELHQVDHQFPMHWSRAFFRIGTSYSWPACKEYCLTFGSTELHQAHRDSDDWSQAFSEHWQPPRSWTACEEYCLSYCEHWLQWRRSHFQVYSYGYNRSRILTDGCVQIENRDICNVITMVSVVGWCWILFCTNCADCPFQVPTSTWLW